MVMAPGKLRYNPRMRGKLAPALALLSALVAWFAATAAAQHVDAPFGYYPPGYEGEAWQGELTALDATSGQFTLTYWKCRQPDTFTGVLFPSKREAVAFSPFHFNFASMWYIAGGGRAPLELRAGKRAVPVEQIPIGASLVVFYMDRKVGGREQHDVFMIGFLPPRTDLASFRGTLTSVDAATQAITFTQRDGRPWRGYLQPGYYVHMRDGGVQLLHASELPLGLPFEVSYRTEKCPMAGGNKKEKVNWIVQLTLMTRPQLEKRR